jgi:2-polyprenyl-3-methyl-5-hydroxy-6-metoxy-1,4-benzoquinol methylase
MSKEDWKDNTIVNIFSRANLWPWKEGEIVTILDAACGLSLKSKYIPAQIRVGVDIYEEYFKHIEADVPYVVVKQDIRKLREIFQPKSFDLVIALDVMEHLAKEESLDVLRQCEEIAKKAVIIETPKGYLPTNMDITGHGGHEWQTHRSEWEPEEFERLGYKTVLRDYTMQDVQRHTEITDIDPHVTMIDAIKFIES